jgi:hypothetical protein
MITFDEILPKIREVFSGQRKNLDKLGRIVVNRNVYGKFCLIVNEKIKNANKSRNALNKIVEKLKTALDKHGDSDLVLYESESFFKTEDSLNEIIQNSPSFKLDQEEFPNITVVDRLVSEANWSKIGKMTQGVPRIVFFSIKGGVGRSTALAVTARALAQEGKRVMVFDLDLQSPGLSSSLLPEENRSCYGITDWLVEDLVDNGDNILEKMIATSDLARSGEIYVIPAHGRDPGEYISKLGRVWMSKPTENNESWTQRLARLIEKLEAAKKPDVILIDSRAGIDEVSAACITEFGATRVLLFAIDGEHTWEGYKILFRYWREAGVIGKIREALQIVAAMIPETNTDDYCKAFLEKSHNLFIEEVYDDGSEISDEDENEIFNYGVTDLDAPHSPLHVRWHRGFSALSSLYKRLQIIDDSALINAIFGPVIGCVKEIMESEADND